MTATVKLSLPKDKTPFITTTAGPITQQEFAPFGDAIFNPCPGFKPQSTPTESSCSATAPGLGLSALPGINASIANQGTALRYSPISNIQDLTSLAPSCSRKRHGSAYDDAAKPGATTVGMPMRIRTGPTMSMFVCRARVLDPPDDDAAPRGEAGNGTWQGVFAVRRLERHPFTSQTFIPLGAGKRARYLVIVAPTRPSRAAAPARLHQRGGADHLAAPEGPGLPGPGMPDLSGLRAFVCDGHQAVTYAAGTWHAPMVVLGNPRDSAAPPVDGDDDAPLSFVVYQTVTGTPVEDCQEVVFVVDGEQDGEREVAGAKVRIPSATSKSQRL